MVCPPHAPPFPDDHTTATRHLCAGAYLDETFRDTALREVYHRRARAVALSHGFTLTPVLAHCLRARGAALTRDAAMIAVLLAALCTAPVALPYAVAVGTALLLSCSACWSLWRQAQLEDFRPGRTPAVVRTDPRLREIDLRQYGNTAVHAAHRPFVGAGRVTGSWTLAQPLQPGSLPFDATDLVGDLQWHLGALVGGPGTVPEATIAGLTVTDRVHLAGTEVGRLDPITPPELVAEIIRRPTGLARHHLACQIPSCGGEVVTTVHIHVAVQAGALFLEVTTTALTPCPDAYRIVDRPEAYGARAWLRALRDGFSAAPATVVRAPVRLVRALVDAVPDNRAFISGDGVRTLRAGWDHGARVAVRELACPAGDHTRYPEIARHQRLIESRLLGAVHDFLEAHGVARTDQSLPRRVSDGETPKRSR